MTDVTPIFDSMIDAVDYATDILSIRCNCDLDNWAPEESTGHTWVCDIHETAKNLMHKRSSHYSG